MNWKHLALALPLSCCLGISVPLAAPSVKINSTAVIVNEAIDADIESKLKAGVTASQFTLSKASDADLAKLCELFPGMTSLRVQNGKRITNLAPLAALGKLKRLELDCQAKDLTPLSGLVGLETLAVTAPMANTAWMEKLTSLKAIKLNSGELTSLKGLPNLPTLRYLTIYSARPDDLTPIVEAMPNLQSLTLNSVLLPDLTPLTRLAKLEDLSFYGSQVKDFSILAGCPKLKKFDYYATKGADYSTLAKLTKLEELQGGLTKLNDISWITSLPNLKKFTLFSEYVKDYTPLAKTKLEYLKIWSMHEPVDLVPVGQIRTLKELVFWSVEHVSGSKALSGLTSLEKLTINDYNVKQGGEHFDLAAASGWKNLKEFTTKNTTFDNFANMAACTALQSVTLTKTQGITSLAPLKQLPALKYVRLTKGLFPDAELQGFGPKVRISQ